MSDRVVVSDSSVLIDLERGSLFDARLRQLAHEEHVACHGVLWLIDQMFECPSATAEQLHAALSRIRDHPRCRLPTAEVNKRLRAFEGAIRRS